MFDYYREFLNCTVNIQINDIRQMPILIPTAEEIQKVESLFVQAYNLKKETPDTMSDELCDIESKLDVLVNYLYLV